MVENRKREPLSETHPEVAAEAMFDATTITAGSGRKLSWKCGLGHEWDAVVANRAKGVGCPVCSNKKVLVGCNDLLTTNPELATQTDADLTKVTAGSQKKITWTCVKGHHWVASVYVRTRGSGCPYCTRRSVLAGYNDLLTTHPELAAECLEDPTTVMAGTDRKVGWRCLAGHEWESPVYTRIKSGCAVCSNHKVLSGYNDLLTTHPELAAECLEDPTTVMAGTNKKVGWRCLSGHEWRTPPFIRVRGHGCPYCANIFVLAGYNDLLTTRPELAAEAMFDATTVTAGSNKKMPWKCALGHEWSATAASRSSRGNGCPACSNQKVLAGYNDLLSTHPELAAEAMFDPTEIIAGSHKKMPWRCVKGHEWEASLDNRTRAESGCPICVNQKVLAGYNDLLTTHPELAAEAMFDPTLILAGTGKKMPWRCSKGHAWLATPNSRSTAGNGCPSCANTGFNPNEQGWVYLLTHSEWEMTQIGITNVPKTRVGLHTSRGWKLRDIRGPMNGTLARQWETDILRYIKSLEIELSPVGEGGNFSGYTESWWTKDLRVEKLKVLMDEIDALETGT
jgi:hypothetical protein